MKTIRLITALSLCALSWICVLVAQSHIVDVQSGEEVTLMCTNVTNYTSLVFWFRLVKTNQVSCIAVLFSIDDVSYCDGFQNGTLETKTNISTVFLKIKHVGVSDSGLYFCGFYANARPIFSVIHLNVNEKCDKTTTKLIVSVSLGILAVVLVTVIIGLAVENRKLKEKNPKQSQNLRTEDLNYAAVTFRPKGQQRELGTNVIYAATR
ncbi:hypothetical protein Q5P01_000033 [Channa striata]|uniref:Immunoglobulin domain-containing protein n=1 Tax=Channa striata TaxID=64152 RepID=A0AA88IR19_CHASR|nr:hypothetical protein Q5P01_000033 [Channa striata]